MIKKHIPNFITCLNLFSGSIAVYFGFQGNFYAVLIAIIIAAIFDFFDGFAARMLKAYSPMGKELDSLADMVSFGLAPGVIAFSLLNQSSLPSWVAFGGFIIPIFSALRLAKFNIDERQTTSFIGMPTPANAIFWAGLGYSQIDVTPINVWFLIFLIVTFSLLLVAEIPMFSLKMKHLSWKDNEIQYTFLLGCAAILIFFQTYTFSILIAWYILVSIGTNLLKKNKTK